MKYDVSNINFHPPHLSSTFPLPRRMGRESHYTNPATYPVGAEGGAARGVAPGAGGLRPRRRAAEYNRLRLSVRPVRCGPLTLIPPSPLAAPSILLNFPS